MSVDTRNDAEIVVDLPVAFSSNWNRMRGISVDGTTLRIRPEEYFFRYENPTWVVCDWAAVKQDLLFSEETTDLAAEQQSLEYVKKHGRTTQDPAEVIQIAWDVYSYIFRDDQLADPDLANITKQDLQMLRELATMMTLNRVEQSGHISNVGPAWFFGVAAEAVFDLDNEKAQEVDELYHGTFFNEYRRLESIRAHAALGGRLVHGCQSTPSMAGGCVVQYGTDMKIFRSELSQFKAGWMDQILG